MGAEAVGAASSTLFATGVTDSTEAEGAAGLPVTLTANRSAVASVGKRRMLSNVPIWLSFLWLMSCLTNRIGADSPTCQSKVCRGTGRTFERSKIQPRSEPALYSHFDGTDRRAADRVLANRDCTNVSFFACSVRSTR